MANNSREEATDTNNEMQNLIVTIMS